MPHKLVAIAGSTRQASLHKQFIAAAAHEAERLGLDAAVVDLSDYPMPLYDGDLEDAEGVPEAAVALRDLIAEADVVLIASPEYNGGYTAVLKNAIDWVTRVEKQVFQRPTVLAAASPGRGGGAMGLAGLRTTLEHMGVHVVDEISVQGAGPGFADRPVVRDLVRSSLVEALAAQELAIAG
ncbi:MAG: NAD(P)H-dependent oxidoreductase [Acidimicrobiia bacterium]